MNQRNKKEKNRTEDNLQNQYDSIMRGVPSVSLDEYFKWEKQGDNFKKFSLYDTSKYETSVSPYIVTP